VLEVFYTSIANSRINNVLVNTAPDLNQLLFHFINALDVCMVNGFLSGRPYLTVNWKEVWAIWKSKTSEIMSALFLYSTLTFHECDVQVHCPA